jgi:hypothetical protein
MRPTFSLEKMDAARSESCRYFVVKVPVGSVTAQLTRK